MEKIIQRLKEHNILIKISGSIMEPGFFFLFMYPWCGGIGTEEFCSEELDDDVANELIERYQVAKSSLEKNEQKPSFNYEEQLRCIKKLKFLKDDTVRSYKIKDK